MRIVVEGTVPMHKMKKVITEACSQAMNIIKEQDKDLFWEIVKAYDVVSTSTVIDVGIVPKKGDDPLVLTTDNGELLTFKFRLDGTDVRLDSNNIDEPVFSEQDQAILQLAEGLKPVEGKLDVTGLKQIYTAKVAGINLEVYENGFIRYFKDGCLVQEATVKPENLTAFLADVTRLVETGEAEGVEPLHNEEE